MKTVFFIFTALLAIRTDAIGTTCVKDTKEGPTFDLTSMLRPGSTWKFTSPTFFYEFQLCYNIEPTASPKCVDSLPSVCLEEYSYFCTSYGQAKTESVHPLVENNRVVGVNMTYGDGEYCGGETDHNRVVSFLIRCGGTTSVNRYPYDDCTLVVEWTHPAGCPIASGIGFGTVMLIILLVACPLVLGVAMAFRRFKRGATGWKMIPFLSFWKSLPGLDGIKATFTCSLCRRSYTTIAG